MATTSGHPPSARVLSLYHPLNVSYHPLHLPVINFRRKDSYRCSQRRQTSRGLTYSALVDANTDSVPSLSDKNGMTNVEVIQSPNLAVVAGRNSLITVSNSSRSRADDIQAEARAMARAVAASVYNPEMLATKYGSRPFKVLRRTFEILLGLGSFGFKLWLDQMNGQLDQKKSLRAAQLRKVFTGLGPTFVKIGQGLSTRPDLCPVEYLEELSQLQDSLPTFPNMEAFICIEKELGFPLEDIYSSLSPNPIAAASLGQVYKAHLKYSGQSVAVKVQRPGIEEAIGLDFFLIRGLAIFINKYVDFVTSDVVALVDEFARRVYQELNYVQEGKNARRFKKLYTDKADVVVPDIFWDYTSGKVLTMEWVDGVKLSEQVAIERRGLKVLDLVNIGIQCSLRQLLEYGYFHADPHPGNLLATSEGKLAFIDFGMMSETPEEARSAIIGHVVHMVNRDYEAMAQDYYALNFLSPDVDVSPIVPELRGFFDGALNLSVSELNFKTLVDGLGSVFYQYPFNVPAYYALILRSLTVLEGLALNADPEFKVLAAAYPYFAKRLLTDPNPYLRDALIELLFKDGKFRWNRLENLLDQGRKDRDFSPKDALQPVLKLLLEPDGEQLRVLVIKETVRVTEALILGSMVDTYNSIPEFMRTLVNNGNPTGPFSISGTELQNMMELRGQVLRVWGLLKSSDGFDPTILQPILQASNLIYVDQPIGTGFSYSSDKRDIRHNEEGVSNDLYDFLQTFFTEHPEFANNEFYITGESYAGHYIPAFAARVHRGNKAKDGIHINLKGIAIGNGLTNPAIQYQAYPDYALDMGLITESSYKTINKIVPLCETAVKLCGTQGTISCLASYVICNTIFTGIRVLTGDTNYYDIRKKCEGRLCYDFSNMEKFLNQDPVRTALGVRDIEFVSCSPTVYTALLVDWMRNLEAGVPALLEDGIQLLVYAGEYDLICNWLGNSRWVHAMEWSGQKDFGASPEAPFEVDGTEAGILKSYGPLSFLKVHDAGHMVPMDQPRAALEMLKRWTKGSLSKTFLPKDLVASE